MDSTEDIASGLNSAAIHLVRRLKKQDSKLNIGPARLSALSVLVFGGPCSLSELAGYEQVTSATMSRIVTGLEGNRLARRKPSPADARALQIEATKKGQRLMLKGQKARVDSLVKELLPLDEKDLACLRQAIDVLRRVEGLGRV
jgi:DNA-binding MarR family transcriptional regulator